MSQLLNSLPQTVSSALEYPYALGAIILTVTLLVTRLVSALNSSSISDNGAKSPPAVPYWIPLLGHIPSMAINADGFVKSLRDSYTNGIFTLNFFGSRHTIIYSPGLATALLNQKSANADNESVGKRIMTLVFGYPRNELHVYDAMLDELIKCYKHIQVEPYLGEIVRQTAQKTKENVQNLVTGMQSPVDQMPWEKVSDIVIVKKSDGSEVVEASLMPLIRDFCSFTANPTLMGSDFLENFPEFFDDIWTLDRGFLLLATGLPRWFPIPMLTRAHIARRKNLQKLEVFHESMERYYNGEDLEPKWSSLDDVGALIQARMRIYREHKLSIRGRAAIEHTLMWAANANSNMLVFWMINRIYSDRALLAMIREEIAPFIELKQLETGLPIAEPPQMTRFDVEGLCNECPLLKSCYVESLRLDTASWSFKTIRQDFVLQSREKDAQPWQLREGFAHVAHDLHNTDPVSFVNPMVWKADRHIKYDEKKQGAADMGSLRPYGGGSSMCKGRAFASKELLIFSAAIIAMWDIEPAGGGPWKMPKHRKATGVYSTADNTRVWVSRRQLP